jgi:hypothetical protein
MVFLFFRELAKQQLEHMVEERGHTEPQVICTMYFVDDVEVSQQTYAAERKRAHVCALTSVHNELDSKSYAEIASRGLYRVTNRVIQVGVWNAPNKVPPIADSHRVRHS